MAKLETKKRNTNSDTHSALNIQIDSPNLEGQVSRFKTLELGAAQSLKAARRKFENQKFTEGIFAADFFRGPPKIYRGT